MSLSSSHKPCSQCKEVQVLTEFHQYKSGPRKGNYWSQCKSCRYKMLLKWRQDNPDSYKLHYKKGRYKWRYGLSLEEVPTHGLCPICLKEKKLLVDHDHGKPKGQYRGFICYNCNTVLGHIENPEKLNRIKQYLKINSL